MDTAIWNLQHIWLYFAHNRKITFNPLENRKCDKKYRLFDTNRDALKEKALYIKYKHKKLL